MDGYCILSDEEQCCFNGHITVDATNLLCGKKYEYINPCTKRDIPGDRRKATTYLRHMPLKDVGCEECRTIRLRQLEEQ